MTITKTTIGIVAAAMMAEALLGGSGDVEPDVGEAEGAVVVEVGEGRKEEA